MSTGVPTRAEHTIRIHPCIFAHLQVVFDPIIMLSNAAAAFGLNMSVFLLIGKVLISRPHALLSLS